MTTAIVWFRNDLRLSDHAVLHAACRSATQLVIVYCHDPQQERMTRWGFARTGAHRRAFLAAALADLRQQLLAKGSDLLELSGRPREVLPLLAQACETMDIFCEAIAAPEEERELDALRKAGLNLTTRWQSSLLAPKDLPFSTAELPDVFTHFRTKVERAGVVPPAPLPVPLRLPPQPAFSVQALPVLQAMPEPANVADERSSFPYQLPTFNGGATAATAHLARYFSTTRAHTYKQTRNGLSGIDYSSKFSPWLASGALSARSAYAALKAFEAAHGANDGSYWLWFELLWRDYFRFLHVQHGATLYRAEGLSDAGEPPHDEKKFKRWCAGRTNDPFIDAGMRELAATGYLSNRLRQNVASYLVHDLGCDWRAGAAWFEAQLIDYDVYSNQGNWLYLAGRGTDPRTGRRFNPNKQAQDYDADGHYRQLWQHR
jgi:deoxyribodipyrimidine photo-lyase